MATGPAMRKHVLPYIARLSSLAQTCPSLPHINTTAAPTSKLAHTHTPPRHCSPAKGDTGWGPVPNARSPASPSPGMINPCSFTSASIIAEYTLSPGYFSLNLVNAGGAATTDTTRTLEMSAPRATMSSRTLQMVPPVASMGSLTRMRSSLESVAGSLLRYSDASSVSSFRT